MKVLRLIDTIFPPKFAYAHCDVPCGIYDPKPAQIAAETVVKMVEKIEGFDNKTATIADRNTLIRAVWTKEEHARKCKEELLILWTDFFRPEHLEMFPSLHNTFWNATKLCSQNKQEVNVDAAQDLKKAVDEIAEMYAKAKAAAKK
ncbi:superoxide dismutase, Ni [Candidatus Curtissbacteria bacterium RIFCSPLOWO2_01_FULL_42_26]|uniref:Superoxide dismutase, Ni n=1 Tax=Candidatus Curtissbacteria bacterium RIFCSPLOWO2_01_FULL_42_26 TaxID=1797729 RepID=A0A1F5HYP7_9BACT|nr:MAG: superoxide dismutase, Ni [Candidatus Curtissbacteria bacterium RIFCSPLOWO2_01_FULL_42_26]